MWLLLTSRWRRRLGTQLLLAATIALAGGAVLACVAGARRTATADDRFIAAAKMPDAAIELASIDGLSTDAQLAAITKLPQVDGWARVANFGVTPTASEDSHPFLAPLDGGMGVDVMKPRYIEGRAPVDADEISMDENRAKLFGLEVGDTMPSISFTPADVEALYANDGRVDVPPTGPPLELRLVGIERTPASIASDLDIASVTTASRAFTEKYGDEIGMFGELLLVDLKPGDGVDVQFAREVQDILGSPQAIEGGGEGTGSVASTVGFVSRSLAIVAAIMAIAGLVAIFAVMLRLSSAARDEQEVLDALGVGPSARRRASALEAGPAAIAGVVGAVIVAAAASPLFPFGLAGRAEPHPGFDLDPLVLVVGGVVLAVAVVVLAILSSRLGGRRRGGAVTRHPSALVRQLAGSGAPVSVVTGSAFVLERGRTSIAARSAAIGVAFGSAGLVAVAVFAASQGALEHTPARWGQVWDAEISLDSLDEYTDADFVAVNDVRETQLLIDDRPVMVRSYASDGDPLMMVVSEGRPAGPGEVILGGQTMSDLGVSIGDRVTLQGNLGETELEVVGQGVFSGVVDVPVIDEGAGVVAQTLVGITDPETDDSYGTWLARLGPETELADLAPPVAAAEGKPDEWAVRELTPLTPDEFDRLVEVRSLPWLLAALLGVLAIATMASMLIVTVRRQRRDLAVLRAVGIAGGGVRRIVSVQALVVSAMGLVVGVPLGIVIGRVAWMSVARGLGVVVYTSVPVLWLLAIVVGVIAVDLVSSLLPARSAARLRPAETLRSE
jgi:hypothetical protein